MRLGKTKLDEFLFRGNQIRLGVGHHVLSTNPTASVDLPPTACRRGRAVPLRFSDDSADLRPLGVQLPLRAPSTKTALDAGLSWLLPSEMNLHYSEIVL
jgi:hypothetical protein